MPAQIRLFAVLLLLAPLAACDDKDGAGPTDDTGGTSAIPVPAVEVDLSEIVPTVATVRWRTEQPTTGRVRFWEVGGEVREVVSTSTPATTHEVMLVGLAEGVDAQLQVQIERGEEVVTTELIPFSTGTFPAEVPRPTVFTPEGSYSLGGFTMMPVGTKSAGWAMIVDEQGRVVWAWGGEGLDTQRIRLTQDGRGVILSDLGPSNPGMDLMRVDFDGTERWRFNVVNAHHDFELVDDDTFLVPVADPREVEVDGVQAFMAADQLVEVRSDGSQREIWNAWDHLTPTAEDLPDMEIPGTIAWLWTHANYLRYVPETDSVQLILRNVDYITEIDRESGDQAWTISAATGAGTALSNPHSVWTTDAGLMVFNQRDFAAEECSGASLLVVDQPTGTVEERWSYESEQCLSVYYTGNAQPLAANRALVAFGSSSMVDEVDMATGQLHWRLSFASGWWLLYTERVEALGPPSP